MLSRIVSCLLSSQSKTISIHKSLQTNLLQTVQSRHYSSACLKKFINSTSISTTVLSKNESSLLNNSQSPLVQQVAGMKNRGELRKRCKHCYFIIKDERKYVMCTVHPRHKAAGKVVADMQGNMILTHATQGSKGKEGKGNRQMKTQQSFRMDF